MATELPLLLHDPEPDMENAKCVVPIVMLRTVPPVPDPLPRRITPLVLILSVLLTSYVPAARRTTPRKPLASGAAIDTVSIAA